ncbi:hypothetical protein CCACVL1_07277, partial [Corchorus capsularis]
EELRLELASTGHITISGERIVNENKSIYFEETLRLPENSDTDNIKGKLDGDFLHVTVPKKSAVVENKQDDESKNDNANKMGENNTSVSVHEDPKDNIDENQRKHEGGQGDNEQHDYDDNEVKGGISKDITCVAAAFPLEMAMKFLKKNKGVVLSAVIAFSIGMLVCRTFESSAGE